MCFYLGTATDGIGHNTVTNYSNIDQGPEIGHTGHYLGGVIGGPIGGAIGLALIVLVWLMLEKRRQDPTRRSTASSESSKDSILEQSRRGCDLESQATCRNADQTTDRKHKKQQQEITPYWGDL